MPTFDPRLQLVLCFILVALAVFNLYLGIKRLHQAHARGEKLRWYKQVGILTGVEYLLLALFFILNLSISNHWLPSSLRSVVLPIYQIVLIFAVALAGIVMYQILRTNRRARAQAALPATNLATPPTSPLARERTDEDSQLRRRERRQKAATARRRRAGKA
jgi:uncharacterized membrane protein YhaH (DUF805 family)